jgi:tRNA(fMet)-specific endonuclease VapC
MEARPATPFGTQNPRFLLDTNICIYIRRKKPEEVLRRFRTLKAGEAALSVITFGELVYLAEKSAQRAAGLELLRELARVLPVIGLPETAAETYGTIRAELDRGTCQGGGVNAGDE